MSFCPIFSMMSCLVGLCGMVAFLCEVQLIRVFYGLGFIDSRDFDCFLVVFTSLNRLCGYPLTSRSHLTTCKCRFLFFPSLRTSAGLGRSFKELLLENLHFVKNTIQP